MIGRERLGQVVAELEQQPVALISAGWQEWEARGDGVEDVVPMPVDNLALYARAERVLKHDPTLAQVLHERQRCLRELQADYRIRLKHAVGAVGELERRHGTAPAQSLRDAYAALRTLDRRHLQHVRRLQADPLPVSEVLLEEQAAIQTQLNRVACVLIAGGHVAVLRNRMRLLGLDNLLVDKHVIAWGAGAMVCTERVVLFLEHSARGRREPEMLDHGLGLAERVIVIPEARRRLKLDDLERCASLSSRFAPARCVSLDGNAHLELNRRHVRAAQGVFRLSPSGRASRVRLS